MSDRDFIELREQQLGPSDPIPQGAQVAATGAAFDRTPIGPAPMAFDVRAVYDSRPVNGYDFNNVLSVLAGEGIQVNPVDMTFTVPNGVVCVLRRVITFIENPVPATDARQDVLITLLVNKGVVPFNAGIPVGVAQNDLINCFVLADEGSTVTVRFECSAAILALNPDFYAQCYGNFLLKTNVPIQFEVANPTAKVVGNPNVVQVQSASPKVASVAAPPVQVAVPAPAPLVRAGPAVPPWPFEWSPILDSHPRQWQPVVTDGRRKRVMTTQEQFTYREFLAATKPRG